MLEIFVLKYIDGLQRSTPADNSYVAAAVEYLVSADVEQNLQNYVQLIKDAAEQVRYWG